MSSLMSMIVFSVIGMWMFGESKRRLNYATLFISMGLMVYPYFTSGPWGDWGIGVLLCFFAYRLW